MGKQYGKCTRCDAIVETNNIDLTTAMCTSPMAVRTSGLCGGSFEAITEKEYKKLYTLIKLKQVFNTNIFD